MPTFQGLLACLIWNSMWARFRGHSMAWAQLSTGEHSSQTSKNVAENPR